MLDRYCLTTQDLEQSKNICLAELKGCDWLCIIANSDQDVLYLDVRRGSVKINGHYHFLAQANEENNAAFLSKKAQQFAAFLAQEFPKLSAQNLTQFYNQSLSGGAKHFIQAGLLDHFLVYDQVYTTNIYQTDQGTVCLMSTLKDIQVLNPSRLDSRFTLPGKVKVNYILTENGFKLDSIQTSNSLLKSLILGQGDKDVTLDKIAFAQAEEELWKALETTVSCHPPILKQCGESVMKKAVNCSLQPQIDLPLLTQSLQQTADVVRHPEDNEKLGHYLSTAHQVSGHRSWGKLLGGSLLIFAGAAMMVMGVAGAIPSHGISLLGIKFGFSILMKGLLLTGASSGLTLASKGSALAYSGREKGLARSMGHLFNSACLTNNRTPHAIETTAGAVAEDIDNAVRKFEDYPAENTGFLSCRF